LLKFYNLKLHLSLCFNLENPKIRLIRLICDSDFFNYQTGKSDPPKANDFLYVILSFSEVSLENYEFTNCGLLIKDY